jgi:hypothetical protein
MVILCKSCVWINKHIEFLAYLIIPEILWITKDQTKPSQG